MQNNNGDVMVNMHHRQKGCNQKKETMGEE
jgi:hypothetical protein